ncbi:hypothetical protein [Formosa sp. S-31]|uniref:hypothetical protein n=1 Tax=Formosa sp. S-31 TaxID=2790949 RepID=UPI003EC101C3
MRKSLIVLLCLTVFLSCKNESKSNPEASVTESTSDLKTFKGDFVYFADAAVLQTSGEIYGVIINDKMHELDEQVKVYKSEATDMVPVEIRGIVIPKDEDEDEEGWPLRIDIKEIVNVSKPEAENNNVIKLGKE